MHDARPLPAGWMLPIALVQGIALFLLYRSVDLATWPSESPRWSYPLWTLAFIVPTLLLLSVERGIAWRVAKLVAAYACVLALVAVYTGSQARPHGAFPLWSLTFVFSATVAIASFKALMYLQQRGAGMPMRYDVLFTNSWRNFLTLGLALVFTFVFSLILMLWGSLFAMIDIDFFQELFDAEWFEIPALAVAQGIGILVFRSLTRVIDTIARLLQALIKLLLPLVVAIAVVFVLSLPFTGLDALWSTGHGTSMLLALLALLLFFLNAVYQDGRGEAPYPQLIHRLLYGCLLVTPVVSALGLYGLMLRVQQYGWSVERCWALVVWLLLTLFVVGYVVGILRRRDGWTADLARVNTGMGLVVLAVLLLANSPVLDFRKISLASQLARVESGEIALEDFDFWYAYRTLARPGYLARREMQAQLADTNPELAARIDNPANPGSAPEASPEDWWARMVYRPAPFEVPAALRRRIEEDNRFYPWLDPVLIRADLDEDGSDEYALILLHREYSQQESFTSAMVYFRQGGEWMATGANLRPNLRDADQSAAALRNGELSLERPRFRNLRLGDAVLDVMEAEPPPQAEADPTAGAE